MAKVDLTGLSKGDSAEGLLLYPVISRIAGKNWTGTCKYIGADLIPLSKLKLIGGVRYDIVGRNVKLSSFITFPNGNTREVVMTGSTDDNSSSPVITLHPIEEGPIRMLLSEVGADTILVNEVEVTTGKTIMTCSTTIIQGLNGEELVQVSHEVGDDIEGHQVWKLKETKYVEPAVNVDAQQKEELARAQDSGGIVFDDFDENFRDTTGQ